MPTVLDQDLALLRATLEAVEDAVLVICRNGIVLGFNQRMLDLWRLPRELLAGSYSDALELAVKQLKNPEACLDRFREIMANPAHEGRDVLEFTDGRVFERYTRPQRVDGVIIGRVFCYRDVSERYRHEEEVQDLACRARVLADASRGFSEARLDFEKVVMSVARRAAEFFRDGTVLRMLEPGGAVATVAFHHVDPNALAVMREILPKDRQFIDMLGSPEVLRTGEPLLATVTAAEAAARLRPEFRPFLERFPLHSWVTVPLRVAGATIGILTVFRFRPAPAYSADDQAFLQDLADRAALAIDNARLYGEAQRAVQIREDFISIASHELRTPLTPLRTQLDMLRLFLDSGEIDAGPFGERLLELLAESDAHVCRLVALVDDMLNVSRMRTGRYSVTKEWVSLSELVQGVLRRWRGELDHAGCVLRMAVEEGVSVLCDRLKVEQVLNNLIGNACKYAPGKPVEVTLSRHGPAARIEVRDHGAGIGEELQRRIFTRFERGENSARLGGLGLGLYIAREIVEAHGGTIRLQSRPGEGAHFIVELPAGAEGRLRSAA